MTTNEFNRLSKTERRMAIAQDVLDTLARPVAHTYRLGHYSYCTALVGDPIFRDSERQLQDLLPEFENHCTVCGIGALFISHVRLANAVTVGAAAYRHGSNYFGGGYRMDVDADTLIGLVDSFTPTQLRTIEAAYEGRSIVTDSLVPKKYREACGLWRPRYRSDRSRLRAICENILQNNGRFVPGDLIRGKKAA